MELADYIMENNLPPNFKYGDDVSWWIKFTVKSAWDLMRGNKIKKKRL